MSDTISVSMNPACTPRTWVCCDASSPRSEFVNDQAAAFDAPYAPLPPSHDSTECMLTSAPPPLAARIGANARVTRRGPNALTSNVAVMSSKSPVSRESGSSTPALLMTMSTSAATRASAATDSADRTSSCWETTAARSST